MLRTWAVFRWPVVGCMRFRFPGVCLSWIYIGNSVWNWGWICYFLTSVTDDRSKAHQFLSQFLKFGRNVKSGQKLILAGFWLEWYILKQWIWFLLDSVKGLSALARPHIGTQLWALEQSSTPCKKACFVKLCFVTYQLCCKALWVLIVLVVVFWVYETVFFFTNPADVIEWQLW